jgi:hypothetical protein
MRLLGLFAPFLLFGSTATIITFDTAPLGRTPPGWSTRWQILPDLSAPTQPYVLAQVASSTTQGRSPLAILDAVSLRDADLSVRIKPVAGTGIQGGGLVWRYRDENNYYMVRANALDNTVAVDKVQNGQRIPVHTGAHREIPSKAWSIMKVSARGNRFQVYMDHRRILKGSDDTFLAPGKVGLWTNADAVTYFDDFRVYPK